MHFQVTMQAGSKRSKGSVGIEVFQGRLRLHLPRSLYGGKNKYLTLGLENTDENWKIAELKAQQIESEIKFGTFDPSLERYKPQRHLKVVKLDEAPVLTIKELWDKYVDFKRDSWSVSTLNNQVAQITRHIARFPTQSLNAIAIRDHCMKTLSLNATKRLLVQLSACCDYGVKSKLINDNPFKGLAVDIKLPKIDDDTDINPFSKQERDAIIEAFESNRFSRYKGANSHASYAPYVKFLFFTGCRPSEAIALTWGDVTDDFVFLDKAAVKAGKNGTVLKGGLKTQSKRRFPVNEQLKGILHSIKPENLKKTDLVFGRDGEYLNQHSFRANVWRTVLKKLGIDYRKPYQTRHTYITLQIAAGTSSTQVAKWVGTSNQMIEDHYLGDISHIKPREI
jgi:integrase